MSIRVKIPIAKYLNSFLIGSEQDISQWESYVQRSDASSVSSIIWMNDVFILTHSDYIGKHFCNLCYNFRNILDFKQFSV